MIWFALALLALGAVVGSRGMRGLGRLVRGPWRPGAGVAGIVGVFLALALAARGQWLAAGVALSVGAVAIGAARARASPPGRPAPSPAALDRREAEQLLGVRPAATPAEVEAAYRRLMRFAHPDAGGTPGLAAKLNAAREVLRGKS